jgi:serine/threonine-protein kinase
MALKGLNEDPRELGRKLNVQVVVEGSVRKLGSSLRVTARLVSVADGFQLWARRFDRSEADVLAVNDETARAIAEALTLHVSESRREVPTDPMAIDHYLRARQEYRQFDPASVGRAVKMFEQALALAPDNPTILSAYAVALGRHWFYLGGDVAAGAGEQARAAAERAIQAAPHMGEPRLALGWIMFHIGDAAGAVREIKTAILRAPALAEAHEMLARILSEVGLTAEANAGFQKALALDPYLHFSQLEIARELAFEGKWDEVDAIIDRIGTEAPIMIAIFYKVRMAMWQGDGHTLTPKDLELLRAGDTTNPMIRVYADGYVRGTLDETTLEEMHAAVAVGGRRFRIYGGQLGAELAQFCKRPDLALKEIGRSTNSGLIDLRWMDRCPLLANLRGTPEFEKLRGVVVERTLPIIKAYRES